MTKRSYHGFYEGLATDWLGSDEPASALRCWTLRNNIQHLVDVSPGYLVNWVSTGSKSAIEANTNSKSAMVSFPVKLIVTRGDRLSNFDVRVATRKNGTTGVTTIAVSAALREIDNNTPIDPDPSIRQGQGAIFYTAAQTTLLSARWTLDTQVTWGANDTRWTRYVKSWSVVESSVGRQVYVVAARFDVSVRALGPAGTADAEVIGVQLREYT